MREQSEAVMSVNDSIHQAWSDLCKRFNIFERIENFDSLPCPKHVLPRKVFHQFFLVLLIFRLIALTNHTDKALKPNSINYWLVDKFNFQKLIWRFNLSRGSTSSRWLTLCSLEELGLNLLV
jgi:hypothetical protein